MSTYKMQVKLIGPEGETIDAWTNEVPADAIYVKRGRDALTAGKCYFRPGLLMGLAQSIASDMCGFLRSRGWQATATDAPSIPAVNVKVAHEDTIRAI